MVALLDTSATSASSLRASAAFVIRAIVAGGFGGVLLSTVNSPVGVLNAAVVVGAFASGGVFPALASLLATGGDFTAPVLVTAFCSCFEEFAAAVPASAVTVDLLTAIATALEFGAATVALFGAVSSAAMPAGAFPAICVAVGAPFPWMSIISRYGLGSRNAEYSVTSSTSRTTRVEPF